MKNECEMTIIPKACGYKMASGDAGRGTPVWRLSQRLMRLWRKQPHTEIALGFELMRRCRKRGWPAAGPEAIFVLLLGLGNTRKKAVTAMQ
jgi:hypothetical protein